MIFLSLIFLFCSLAVLHTYLLYPLTLGILDQLWPRKAKAQYPDKLPDELPSVSVIVAAYNERKVIGERIRNALELHHPPERLEVIIASDGSDDGTPGLVAEAAAADPRVRLLDYPERRGKVNVLNDAVATARGEILLFSDANVSFREDALRTLLAHFANPRTAVVCGRLIFEEGATHDVKTEGIYWKLETWLKKREGRRGSLLGANGAIFAMRKDLWETCPPDTLVEDFFIPMRLLQKGWQVFYEPAAIAVEEAAPSMEDEFVRRIRIGAGDFQALSRLLPMLAPSRGFASYAFFSHKVLRWLTPFLMIGALASNLPLALLATGPWFKILLICQLVIYALAIIGIYWRPQQVMGRILAVPTQFVMMNLALFLGFFRWCNGSQRVAWKRTPRTSEGGAPSL
ncbi:MAG: glycosyltransferase family 2 protein [Verrucomicrobiaceae bacterium]|nr:MAG: glycosyltransferase family 2 protein [Verrucomicrobiaceae bacterium]